MIRIDYSQIQSFIPAGGVKALEPEVKNAIAALEKGSGAGNDFIG